MATALDRDELIAQIRELPARLEEATRGISEERLSRPAGGESWSIRQVVHHLADAHMNAVSRMKLILTEERPILKPYDQEAWADLPDATQLPLGSSMQILRGLHHRWSALLATLPEASWQRKGVHLENGLMTLDDALAVYSEHGQVHLRQIAKIRAGLGL